MFLGGSSFLAFSWCNNLLKKDNIILGVHNKNIELDGFKTININFKNLKNQLKSLEIDVIINCIGYTSVENCEINPENAEKINVQLPLKI